LGEARTFEQNRGGGSLTGDGSVQIGYPSSRWRKLRTRDDSIKAALRVFKLS
jgi:hypothetical protein